MNGHDTDPTPPHGTERPPTPTNDLREHLRGYFAGRFSVPDPDAITTQVLDALDALALAVWAWHNGDGDTLRDVLTASGRDWFGWFRCPSCHAETAIEDQGEGGYCLDCDAATDDDIAETIRANAWEIATETGDFDDDQDEPRTILATITYDDDPEPVAVLFGVFPSGYSGTGEDLPGDWRVFFWLDEEEASRLAPGFGMGDGWTVVTIDD